MNSPSEQFEFNEVLGLLLDLDEGSLAIYHHIIVYHDRTTYEPDEPKKRLGYMIKSGITGPVVWAAQMHNWGEPVAMLKPGLGSCTARMVAKDVPIDEVVGAGSKEGETYMYTFYGCLRAKQRWH